MDAISKLPFLNIITDVLLMQVPMNKVQQAHLNPKQQYLSIKHTIERRPENVIDTSQAKPSQVTIILHIHKLTFRKDEDREFAFVLNVIAQPAMTSH